MFNGKKIVVVMPAYRAALTLERTYREIPLDLVDEVILVDDASPDDTVSVARELGIRHVIMLHPDYQYTPLLLPAMISIIANGLYPVVFGSRILGKGALKGGMPMYKYIANRFLTFAQNVLMNQKLSEYHTGYRAFSAEVLRKLDFTHNSDDFIFDNEMIAQIFHQGFEIGEVTCPTKYFDEASSINFRRSSIYGLGVLKVSLFYRLARWGLIRWPLLDGAKPQSAPATASLRVPSTPV
jgi:glycosyltransferase involved in cell wall biosynthesis